MSWPAPSDADGVASNDHTSARKREALACSGAATEGAAAGHDVASHPTGRPPPSFYALGGGRVGELVTLLHLPYTLWLLANFSIGAALAPRLYVGRWLWGMAAFALAVGVAAHALDELNGRPMRTSIGDRSLLAGAVVGLAGASAIGVAGALTVTVWLVPFVLAGVAFVVAYNLELAGGRFHSELWLALGWAAFPVLTGYFIEAQRVRPAVLLAAGGCMGLSFAQRRLSVRARELRRRTVAVEGSVRLRDGRVEELSVEGMLAPLEGALSAMSAAAVLLAAALVAVKL
jgi:hypothetical protein